MNPGLSQADLDRVTALLRDGAKRAEFLRTLEALSAASRATLPAHPAEAGQAPAAAAHTCGPIPCRPVTYPLGARHPDPGRRRGRRGDPARPGSRRRPGRRRPRRGAGPRRPAAADPLIAPNTIGAQLLAGLSGRIGGAVRTRCWSRIRSIADLPALWAATANLLRDPVSQTRLTGRRLEAGAAARPRPAGGMAGGAGARPAAALAGRARRRRRTARPGPG